MINNEEYVYASKGITFFYNTPDGELDSLAIYEPRTLEEYRKNYTDMYPFWQPK